MPFHMHRNIFHWMLHASVTLSLQPSHNADNVGPYTFVSLIWMDLYTPPHTIVLRNISMTPK